MTSAEDDVAWRRRLSWLMGGRLLVTTLLLGGFLLVQVQARATFTGFTSQMLVWLVAATYGLSLLFALWLPRARTLGLHAAVQLGWDVFLTTGLVWLGGGVESAFTFLYGITILAAALVAGQRASNATALAALLLFAVVGVSVAAGYLPPPPDQAREQVHLSSSDLGFAVLRNFVGLLVVTALASNLADRLSRARGQLRQATESAARFARLNDDIVRSLTSGLLTTDEAGRIVTINPAGAEMLRATVEELVGKPAADFLPIDARPSTRERGEGEGTRAGGAQFPVGWTQTPLRAQDGTSQGTLIVFQDLTQIRELQAAAERQERLAALGRVAASMAHEIRNPLGSISGSVELVRENAEDAEDRRLLGIVITEVERLEDLVTTILDVSRPRTPQKQALDLAQVVREVTEIARNGVAARQGVAIDLAAPDRVPAVADAAQVRQMLWNLIKNAVQASPRASSVMVEVRPTPEGGAVVEVRDRGTGMTAEERDRVFDMFWSGRSQGIGLGLALVKQIVDAHAATIEVEPRPEGGTIFRVTLPQAEVSRESVPSRDLTQPRPGDA